MKAMVDYNLPKVPKTLKKVLIVFRYNDLEVRNALVAEGFEIVKKNPDYIICYGGDGTVLFGERKFPEIPKLIVKTSRTCRVYDYKIDDLKKLLIRIKAGNFKIHSEIKLETETKGKLLVGLNEIQVHLKLPIYAVRFDLIVNGKKFNKMIGDGVVVATPFGSTGYYKATGGSTFKKGIGISFNNLHNKSTKNFVVSEDSIVKLTITRGPAWLLADNNEDFVDLDVGDTVIIKKSQSVANFIYFPD
jgi:NAD+ kinase